MEKSNRGGRGGRSFGGDRGGRSFGGDRGGRGGSRGGRDFGDRPEMFDAVCSDCGEDCQVPFKPSRGKPVLCRDCFKGSEGGREERGGRDRGDRGDRRDRRDSDRREDKKRYDAVCCECGKDFDLPFRPSPDRAVYCSDCFEGKKGENEFSRGGNATEEADFSEYFEEKFAELNAKLDAVVRLLTGKTEETKPSKEKKAKKEVKEVVEAASEVVEVKEKKEKKAKKAKK